jgi:uncharacterized protein
MLDISSIRAARWLAPALLALSALSTLAARPGAAQQPVPTVPSTIATSAVGEERVVPDRARLSIGVQTQAATAADASARNARLQKAVIDTLRALGIPQELITTSGFNVYPEQTYDQATRRSRITAYNVQNTVVVELRRVEQVGSALDAVLAKGANLVSSLAFFSSDAEGARRRALANAVERARQDAEAIARAAGGALGPLVEITSVGYVDRPRPMMEVAMARGAVAQAVETPISEGTQTITATVTARWSFVSAR